MLSSQLKELSELADVWATADTVDLVTEAQSFKEIIKAVINCY